MKLDILLNEMERLDESGIRGIKELAKTFNKCEIWAHVDADGIFSAIAMKEYMKQHRIKTVDVHPIQYGAMEYAVPKGRPDTLKILVDMAHGKYMFHIHHDHHEGQVGVEKDTATVFKKKPSGAGIISGDVSPRQIFSAEDLKVIDTVDSADFARQGLTPDDIIRASFGLNKDISVKDNRMMMGFVVNKLLLTYKNKPGFLKELAMKSNPSVISIYNNIKKLAKEHGYVPPEKIDSQSKAYQDAQKAKIQPGDLNKVKSLKNGQSMLLGNLIVQYGAGYMGKGNTYDRYTPFKLHPEANYFTIAWSMGLIQLSKNPFKKLEKDLHLGNIVMGDVMPKFKSTLKNIDITLDYLKFSFERDIGSKGLENAVGFTFKDFFALYSNSIKGLPQQETGYKKLIQDITDRYYKDLSDKQKAILKRVTVNAWDVIMAGSGGHKSITNLTGMNFIKKDQYSGGYTQLLRDIQYEIAKRMMHE